MLQTSSHQALLPGYDVVIPSFQRVHVVADVVRSVLRQSHKATRIILIDDGSSDNSARMVETLGRENPCVVPVLLPRNGGASTARNAGLAECCSEWIAFLNSDDSWVKDTAASLLGAAMQDALDLAVGLFSRIGSFECSWDGSDIRMALRTGSVVGPSWSIIRRDVVLAAGGWDPSFRTCEDWDFFVRVAATGARFGRIARLVAYSRTVAGERLIDNDADLAVGFARVLAHPFLSNASLRVEAACNL